LPIRSDRGDQQRWLATAFERHRNRLRTVVRVRLDPRLAGRIDPSDVLQETYLEASARFDRYCEEPSEDRRMPFFLWLRFLAMQRLMILARRHLGTQARDPSCEVSIYLPGSLADSRVSSVLLANQLLARQNSPSQSAARRERRDRLISALEQIPEIDREILLLRHFEELSNLEAARLLRLSPTATNNRYVRALRRLRMLVQPLSPAEPPASPRRP
jgi:RNA polymerase sigma-70 factor (ECF subfamily)